MGCVCAKPSSEIDDSPKQRELIRKTSELRMARAVSREKNDSFSVKEKLEKGDVPKQRELIRKTSELRMGRAVSREKNDSFSVKEKLERGDVKIGLIDRSNVSRRVRDDYYDKKRERDYDDGSNCRSMGSLPKAVEGEQVAAGWPSWLVAVAGEAIRGWVPRKAETFEKLDKIGQGTYSSVYKGHDLMQNKAVALKKVRFDNMDPESVKFMAREILILRRLDHPNVIKLEGLVTSKTSCSLYLVFEYMEHDLTGLASLPGVKFTEPQVKCYVKQLLNGLNHCHSNGVLHRDIKGSNLLINNHGNLKIADFGLASYFGNNQKVPLTSQVVTLWYRPPELLLGSTQYGVAVDLWSTGCILGELYAGKPIMRGRTEVEQLHKIFKLCGSPSEDYWRKSKLPHSPVLKPIQPYRPQIAETFKNLPETAVRLMETLLSVDPSERGTTSFALQSEFFKTEPFACDPSSLPKYPPSKEIDAKLREEQARRRGAVGVKGPKCEYVSKRSKESQSAAAPVANADLARSMQRRHGNVNLKCLSELFNPQKDGPAPGLNRRQSDDPWQNHQELVSNSGPLAPRAGWTQPGRKNNYTSFLSSRNDSYGQAGPTASTRGLPPMESREKIISSCVGPTNQAGWVSDSFGEPARNQDGRRQTQVFSGSENAEKMGKRELDTDGHEQERTTHFSGPLLSTSNNTEQMLKEHDRRVQEPARRARNEKTRVGTIRAH